MLFFSANHIVKSIFVPKDFIKFIEISDPDDLLFDFRRKNNNRTLLEVLFSQGNIIDILNALEVKLKNKLYNFFDDRGHNILHFVLYILSKNDISYLLSEDKTKCKLLDSHLERLSKLSDHNDLFPVNYLDSRVEQSDPELFFKSIKFTRSTLPNLDENLDFSHITKDTNLEPEIRNVLIFVSQVINELRKTLLFSPTLRLIQLNVVCKQCLDCINRPIAEFRDRLKDSLNNMLPKTSNKPEKEDYKALFNINTNMRYANCDEMANYVAIRFEQAKIPISCETFYIENGDHVFNVINRAKDSDPSLPDSWGRDCFIVDSWAGRIFNSRKFYEEIKNMVSLYFNFYTIHFLADIKIPRQFPNISNRFHYYPN